ncbi:MAG: hypothetical protein GX643_11275 [Acidimicrobiales bacterium]|nr:hypothetical protein [Acidimicrobiales bacterium]
MSKRIVPVLACVLALSACLVTRPSEVHVVTAPDASATGFGSAFSMDEQRLVARAVSEGSPVVYVFDAFGSGWEHTATISAPPTATDAWGSSVAVSGDTIAVADPYFPATGTVELGRVTLYSADGGAWAIAQQITAGQDWTSFAAGVWLSERGLVVQSGANCDSTCSVGTWTLYHRYGQFFSKAFQTSPGVGLSVGVDEGRFALGNPGGYDIDSYGRDNALRVIDANVTLPHFILDEVVPLGDPYGTDPLTTDLFRKVDISGDLLAYESCCSSDDRLHIRRFDGTTYQPEATFPLDEQSESVVALPGLVMVADPDEGEWHTYAFHDGEWKRSSDLPAPDHVAGQFEVPPVAVGDRVAVAGDGVIHILTVEVVEVEDD